MAYVQIQGSLHLSHCIPISKEMYFRASNGDEHCFTDYLVLPGGHCKDDESHYSTDRFCGNTLGVEGMAQSIVQYSSPFMLQVSFFVQAK